MLIENDDYAKNVLSKIGYYTLINGYKGLFLRKNDRGNILIRISILMERKLKI